MDELKEAERTFLSAIRSTSDLPGINEINLATAMVALLRAERISPLSEETQCMQAIVAQMGRREAYLKVKSFVDGLQP